MNHTRHSISGNSFILIFIVLFLFIIYLAINQSKPINPNQYKHVTIEKGDTLWSLADTYANRIHQNHQEFIKWVEATNHISSEYIVPGEKIIIPIKS